MWLVSLSLTPPALSLRDHGEVGIGWHRHEEDIGTPSSVILGGSGRDLDGKNRKVPENFVTMSDKTFILLT